MLHRPLLLALLLPLLPLAVFAAPSAPPARKEDPVVAHLRADSRLSKPVTLELGDRPLGEALPELGKTLGLSLTADRSVADDQVTFFCENRPARELLPLLSSHFGFLWRRKGEGYQLWQDLAGQQREAKLRVDEVQRLLVKLNVQLDRLVEVSAMTPEAQEAAKKKLLDRLNTGTLAPAEREEVGAQIFALDSLDPLLDGGAALLRVLTPAQVRALAAGDPLNFSTIDSTLQLPIARRIKAALNGQDPGWSTAQATGVGASLQISDGVGSLGPDSLEIAQSLVKPVLSFRGMFSSLINFGPNSQGSRSRGWFPLPAESILTELPTPPPPDPELLGEVELVAKPHREQLPLSQVAKLIHEATGLPILSDSFIRTRISDRELAGKKPLYQVLRTIRQRLGYSCEWRDGVLRLRSERYFRDRPREIPQRLRKQWNGRLTNQGIFSLNDLAEIASTLSDEQLRGLSTYWVWQFEPPVSERRPETPAPRVAGPPIDLRLRRYDLRFWRSLNAAQQAVARKGVLPIGALNGVQQQLALLAFETPEEEQDRDITGAVPPRADLVAGGFSLTQDSNRYFEFTVRQADGSASSRRRSLLSSGAPLPEPPELNAGDRLQRSTQQEDIYRFRYFLPERDQPAGIRTLTQSHLQDILK